MAAVGCAYGPVGNSCPGLYRTGPDSYTIASPRYDDDDNPSLPECARLTGICTDLWAYSIAGLHWKSQGSDPANSAGVTPSWKFRPGRVDLSTTPGNAVSTAML